MKQLKQESLIELIRQATGMLLDRSKPEQDLIYHIAKLDNECKASIIIAYEFLYVFKEDNERS